MKLVVGIGVVMLVVAVGWWMRDRGQEATLPEQPRVVNMGEDAIGEVPFKTSPKKAAHYESNTPEHGAVLVAVPVNVVIDFNFDLARPSEIKILKEGQDWGEGETIIDTNKLVMRRKMKADASDGLYIVEYKACWPDKSCHDGRFEFAINRLGETGFVDMRNKSEVTIDVKQFAFNPQPVRISRGTKVTWTNQDEAEHYINTDAHPAHTYVKEMNSKSLGKGETYSYTFSEAGIYPYHCSAHTNMKAQIVVD